MDAQIILSFDEAVIKKAKNYAENNNISLSRLTEFWLRKLPINSYHSLEDLQISDWLSIVAEGEVEYKTKSKKNKDLNAEYFKSKKWGYF